jgi:2-methylcitrate dehydratase PrpD
MADHPAGLAHQLGTFAVDAREHGIPDAVADSVRQRVLDTLGICLAASPLDTSRAARRWVIETGGAPQATAIGCPSALPASAAAFANGVLAHSLDYDDTHLPSVLHPSASVIPAALAAAQHTGSTGSQAIRAIAVGLETTIRLGMAGFDEETGNSTFFEFGQHATSICGAMGSAVAAAMLYGLPADGIAHALGVAASMASGIIESNRTGGTVKRMHCGWAAQSGVSAAQLVIHGFTGPPTVLEGRFGFLQAWLHGSTVDLGDITDALGEAWTVPEVFFKPYPANHFTHAGIDAARQLRADGVEPDDITHIELRVAEAPHRTIGTPIDIKRAPQTGYMAQFSGPYTVVAGLLGGSGLGVGLDDFTDELANDPQRRSLMSLVDVVVDERCTKIFPYQFPAIVTVTTRDGRAHTREVLANRGGPDWPLTFDELTVKFTDNARRVMTDAQASTLADACARLEELESVDPLFDEMCAVDPLPSRH